MRPHAEFPSSMSRTITCRPLFSRMRGTEIEQSLRSCWLVLIAPHFFDAPCVPGSGRERVAAGAVVAVDSAFDICEYRLWTSAGTGAGLLPAGRGRFKRGYRSRRSAASRFPVPILPAVLRAPFGVRSIVDPGFRQREGVVSHTITAASSGRTKPIRKSRHPRSHRILQGPFVVPYDPQSVPDVWHSGGRSSKDNLPNMDDFLYFNVDTWTIIRRPLYVTEAGLRRGLPRILVLTVC